MRLILWLLSPIFLCVSAHITGTSSFTPSHLRQLKAATRALFRHGWDSYMTQGFPADEVKPYTCEPYGPQYTNKDDIHLDALGNVSSTLLDNLDTLLIMQEWDQLGTALAYLSDNKEGFFNQNHSIQVFEASIRWLGGLLSAHLALTNKIYDHPAYLAIVSKYDGFLLEMAYDLGLRLIPVYKTSTNLPLPRINLATGLKGVNQGKPLHGCTAGATTPFLEFTLLSRLTGDEVFESLTKKTFYKIWDARSPLGLLPMTFDPVKNMWIDSLTGVGASVDSFYEYALKGAILFNDDKLMSVFQRSYSALLSHSAKMAGKDGYMYFGNVDTLTGLAASYWIDSLSAFWPGVQVLAGRLSEAVRSHLVFLKIWNVFDGLPERWNYQVSMSDLNVTPEELHKLRVQIAVGLEWYPLRPEFIESTYYLYRATRDPLYLQIGARVLELFESRFKAPCGFGGYQDVRNGELQDRMETFVLGESLKYLYLLFDENDESYVHSSKMKTKNWIFSTEAHPLWYDELYARNSREGFHHKLRQFCMADNGSPNKNRKKSMWRGFKAQVNAIGPGYDPEDSEVVEKYSQLRPVAEDYEWCEVAPAQWKNTHKPLLQSSFYKMGQMFSPEKDFDLTLVRPKYLEKVAPIELTPSFTKIYGLGGDYVSTRDSTTQRTEFIIGALSRPEAYKTYIVREDVSEMSFKRGDTVMPKLSGRLKVEHLVADAIDQDSQLVTYETLRNLSGSDTFHGSQVLRLYEINGREINGNAQVWTEREFLDELAFFSTKDDGRVLLNNQMVANLRVY